MVQSGIPTPGIQHGIAIGVPVLLAIGYWLAWAVLRRMPRLGLGPAGGVQVYASQARLCWSRWSSSRLSQVRLSLVRWLADLQAPADSRLCFGEYVLQHRIGEGAMGVVYRALAPRLDREVAIKVPSDACSATQRQRFEWEARVTARLSHPNLVTVYDWGRNADGLPYYAMELLEGLDLDELVARHGPLSAGRAIHVLLQVCAGLDEAHRAGLVHRDIKPANVYLCTGRQPADQVKLVDFGLVRDLAEAGAPETRCVLGTPLYLAPESITDPEAVDARADIYALGALAYYLVCGQPPFLGQSSIEVCAHHLKTPPVAPSKYQPLASDFETIILSCLAKDPSERPASAGELGQLLRGCRDADSWDRAAAEAWWQCRSASQDFY